jgi:hypothetical protein
LKGFNLVVLLHPWRVLMPCCLQVCASGAAGERERTMRKVLGPRSVISMLISANQLELMWLCCLCFVSSASMVSKLYLPPMATWICNQQSPCINDLKTMYRHKDCVYECPDVGF